ncbi:MAG: hypothetical protein O2930_12010 [Acidobacteria bacterium]|nr:hypothetical protein [Acidobacteriota bacterium]
MDLSGSGRPTARPIAVHESARLYARRAPAPRVASTSCYRISVRDLLLGSDGERSRAAATGRALLLLGLVVYGCLGGAGAGGAVADAEGRRGVRGRYRGCHAPPRKNVGLDVLLFHVTLVLIAKSSWIAPM